MNNLGLEVALLIAAAKGKGIDVHIWFGAQEDGLLQCTQFNSKLISLGVVVGFQEDWETRRELELATSKRSLREVQKLCLTSRVGSEEPLIDFNMFIRLCEEKVKMYICFLEKVICIVIDALQIN